MLFLAIPHAIPCTTGLRLPLSHMLQDFFLLGVLQLVSPLKTLPLTCCASTMGTKVQPGLSAGKGVSWLAG